MRPIREKSMGENEQTEEDTGAEISRRRDGAGWEPASGDAQATL